MKKSVYGLVFTDQDNVPTVFYVGCTNDIVRRTSEHNRFHKDAKHPEYDTYKYRFCRDLASLGIGFSLEVLAPAEEVTDDADEYSWILKFARYNESKNIKFFDDLPLTNMKAGDFLEEMLRDRTVVTGEDVRQFRIRKEQERTVEYERKRVKSNPKARAILDKIELEMAPERAIKQAKLEAKHKRGLDWRVEREKWLAEQEQKWREENK